MIKPIRFLAWLAALLLGMGCAVAAVAGLGGGLVPKLDILNQLTPFWLAGGLLALAMALTISKGPPRWLVVIPAGAAVIVGGVRVAPEIKGRLTPGVRPGAERLKVIQYNAYILNRTPERSIDWLLAQDADIVVIEEGEGLPEAQVLRLRARYPHCNGCLDHWWSNIILAKQAPTASGRFERPNSDSSFPILGGWSRFAGPGGEFTVIGVHMDWPWRWFGPSQRAGLSEFANRNPTDRTILVGDFNMAPWSNSLRDFDRQVSGLTRRTHGQATWPGEAYYRGPKFPVPPLPLVAIDQVYAGDGWRTVSVKRGPRIGSDHYPIVVELTAR